MFKCIDCGKLLEEKPKELIKTLPEEIICEDCQEIMIKYIETLLEEKERFENDKNKSRTV